jgi:multiple sugar transport system permease protein
MTIDGAGRGGVSGRSPCRCRARRSPRAIFTFLGSWDEFIWALTVINNVANRTLPIGIALFRGQHSTSWGLIFAASIIAIVPVIAVYLTFQRHIVSGLTNGALRG